MSKVQFRALWLVQVCGLTSLFVPGPSAAWAQCRYELTTFVDELPYPEASHNVRTTALNDLGQAAGYAGGKVFIWTPETGIIILNAPGTPNSPPQDAVMGMNNIVGADGIGQIVCNLRATPSATLQAYLYDDGVWTRLSSDPTYSCWAEDINDQGQICGERNTPEGHKFFRWENGEFTNFDPPIPNSVVWAMNNHGTVVGNMPVLDAIFSWNGGEVNVFESFEPESIAEWPFYINNFGHIAGDVYFPPDKGQHSSAAPQAYLLRDDDFHYFEVEGYPYSSMFGLNDLEQVVLQVWFDHFNKQGIEAMLWQHGKYARLVDLFEPVPFTTFFQPTVLNNRGQMTGWYTIDEGYPSGSEYIGAILTPINRPLGDVDCDCQVTPFDLSNVLRDWGACSGPGVCPSDIVDSATFLPPGDGVVDGADLAVVLGNWGASTAVR